jgi:hypothetical protein
MSCLSAEVTPLSLWQLVPKTMMSLQLCLHSKIEWPQSSKIWQKSLPLLGLQSHKKPFNSKGSSCDLCWQSVTKIQTREQKGKCMYKKKRPFLLQALHHSVFFILPSSFIQLCVIQVFLHFHFWLKHCFFICNIISQCHSAKLKLTYIWGFLTALGIKMQHCVVWYTGTNISEELACISYCCLHLLP